MLISCEKCSTTYVLDSKLIPPGGAPVQCTRCQHVFTARPEQPHVDAGGVEVLVDSADQPVLEPTRVSAPPRPPPRVEPRRPVFTGSSHAAPPGLAPRTSPPAPAPVAPAQPAPGGRPVARPYSPAEAEKVLARFEASRDAAGGDEEPSEGRRERTQLFALSDIKPPAGPAPAPQAAPAPGPRSGSTQLFSMSELGLVPETPAPAGPEPQVLAQSPPGEESRESRGAKTQLFALADLEREQSALAAPPPAPVAPAAGPGPFQPIRTGTVLFALSDAQRDALAAPEGSRPAPAPAAPAAAPRMTQLFGLEPERPEDPTVVAEAPSPDLLVTPKQTPAVFTQPPRTETPMFGLEATAPPPAAPSPRATQVFGAVPGPGPIAPIPRGTQVFGAVTSPSPAAPSPRATQVFGAVTSPSTAAPSPRATQVFGAVTSPSPAAPSPRATQVFGAVPGASAQAPSPRMTQLFGLEGIAAPLPPGPEPLPQTATPLDFPAPDAATTPAEMPAGMFPDTPVFSPPAPPESPAERAERLQRPPERGSLFPPEPQVLTDDPEAVFRAGLKRRNRLLALFGALVLVALGGFVAFKVVTNRRPVPPPAVVAERDTAFALLRRDNGEAKQQAAQRLAELSAKNPQFPDIQAALLIATALQLDDMRLEIRRLQSDAEELNKKINRLKEAQSPGDWENRVNAMAEEVGALKKASDPLVEQAAALDLEVGKTFRNLTRGTAGELSKAEELALVRAQAIYFGVKGGDQAAKLSERYKALLDGADDGWGAVAFAEYAANARVDAATVRRARADIDGLRARDSTFLRPYVLSARLALAAKEYEAASGALEAVLLLDPKHQTASKLLGWVKQEAAVPVPPAPPP